MRYVRYRRAKVPVEAPLRGVCECCGRVGKTDTHHFVYAYPTREVKRRPELALENTAELCFFCHRIATAMKLVGEAPPEIVVRLWELESERVKS